MIKGAVVNQKHWFERKGGDWRAPRGAKAGPGSGVGK